MFDISSRALAAGDRMAACRRLLRCAGDTPVLVLCDAPDEPLALQAVEAGAAQYAIKDKPENLEARWLR